MVEKFLQMRGPLFKQKAQIQVLSAPRHLMWVWQIEEAPGPLDSMEAIWREPPPLALTNCHRLE